MGTDTEMGFCHVAVPTQGLKSFGIAELAKFYVERTTSHIMPTEFASVLVSVSENVVNGKKGQIAFAATGALGSVMLQNRLLNLVMIPTISRPDLFGVLRNPRSMYFALPKFVLFCALGSPFSIVILALGALSFVFDGLVFAATDTHTVLFALIVACSVVSHAYSIHHFWRVGNKKAAQWPLQHVWGLVCSVADVVGGVVIGQHCPAQGFSLVGRRLELDLGNQFHRCSIAQASLVSKLRPAPSFFLSPMNRGVSKGIFL